MLGHNTENYTQSTSNCIQREQSITGEVKQEDFPPINGFNCPEFRIPA